jgi:hypothetical protein
MEFFFEVSMDGDANVFTPSGLSSEDSPETNRESVCRRSLLSMPPASTYLNY